MAAALGSFEVRQFAPKNRFDDFKLGNRTALSAAEIRGLDLFEGKARCSGCHSGVNFTDESFRNNGLAVNSDVGRADFTGRSRDYKLFKVPSLRSLKLTAPYMHDGSKSTLKDVVDAYNLGATRAAVLWTITLPYLKPALIGSAAISFLMSFENFNTTLMLVGSDAPLTVMMYGRMREGATPVLNAVLSLIHISEPTRPY